MGTPTISAPVEPPRPNMDEVVLGDRVFEPWYMSFYPEDIIGKHAERLYVCQWCFKYTIDIHEYAGHISMCEDKEPPGVLIYDQEPYKLWEVDGDEYKLFAQNLSIFAKLFLDNKSVFFDVVGFHYYILTVEEDGEPRIVGFFSKEKLSWNQDNLACILVFPPWQRQGVGKILMGISYELSKREGKIGGPEKPLSELGRKSYLRFWTARVAMQILEARNKSSLSVAELAEKCYMLPEDVITALRAMGICQVRAKNDGMSLTKSRVLQWAKSTKTKLVHPVDPDAFVSDESEEVSEEDDSD